MQPTFTFQEVQNIITTFVDAVNHWQKTMTMATNDAMSQANIFLEKKKQELVDQQKRVAEQLAKRAKESEAKNDCDPTPEVNEEAKQEAKVDKTKK